MSVSITNHHLSVLPPTSINPNPILQRTGPHRFRPFTLKRLELTCIVDNSWPDEEEEDELEDDYEEAYEGCDEERQQEIPVAPNAQREDSPISTRIHVFTGMHKVLTAVPTLKELELAFERGPGYRDSGLQIDALLEHLTMQVAIVEGSLPSVCPVLEHLTIWDASYQPTVLVNMLASRSHLSQPSHPNHDIHSERQHFALEISHDNRPGSKPGSLQILRVIADEGGISTAEFTAEQGRRLRYLSSGMTAIEIPRTIGLGVNEPATI